MQKLLKGSSFKPVNIYALIIKDTKHPFYVGATIRPIKKRLAEHIKESYCDNRLSNFHCSAYAKNNFLKANAGNVDVVWLFSCDKQIADHYERFFYSYFLSMGFHLYNDDAKFTYSYHKSFLKKD